MDLPLDLSMSKKKDSTDLQSFLTKLNVVINNNLTLENLRKIKSYRNILYCNFCQKIFDRPSLLKRHIRTHTGEKPNICEVCKKGFSTSSSLNTHRRIHSGLKPFKCPVCQKCFTASSNLYYHKLIHTKNKPHKCLICPKSYATPGDLRAHFHVHSGVWPFMCKCGRGFAKKAALKSHQKIHKRITLKQHLKE